MLAPDGSLPPFRLPPRHVVILATPTAQSLEVAGPAEVFAMAAEKLREAGRERLSGYTVEVVAAVEDLHVRSSTGLTLLAQRTFREVDYEIDTLLVAGGMTIWSGADQLELLRWLRERCERARRYGSVCTGAFVLGQAGLLQGRRATTHWYFCQQLQAEFPEIVVDPEPIFVRDDRLFTSAGVASGLDLALAMVEDDFGQDTALRVARALVLFLRRSAGQNQFSTALAFQGTARVPLRELPIYVLEHLREPLNVEELAQRVSMSVRNFSRVFREEYGCSPGVFVERLRVDTARRLVEESLRGFEEVAAECGLGTGETLRRIFVREFGQTPPQLRKQAAERSL